MNAAYSFELITAKSGWMRDLALISISLNTITDQGYDVSYL